MRCVVLKGKGGIDRLVMEERDLFQPGPGEIRVRVCACGVCYRDIIDRKGGFPWIRFPIIPGHEIAGVVDAIGPGVEDLAPGERVISLHRPLCGSCSFCLRGEENHCSGTWQSFGLTIDGGYAEAVVAPRNAWVKIADLFTPEEAATLVCTYGTVWHGFFRVAGLKPGEKVIVTGGSGGVGSAAIQIARTCGCDVTAVTRTPEKKKYLEDLGSSGVIVAPDCRFHEGVAPEFDLGVETVGEPTLPSLLRVLRPGGRILLIGNVTMNPVSLRLGQLIVRGQGILGTDGCTRRDLEELMAFMAYHHIKPRICRTFPLEEAPQAQKFLEDGLATGRVVLSLSRSW